MTTIYNVLGALLALIIARIGDFVPAVIGFTVVTKIVLIPLGLFQHRSTINQMKIRPQEEAIRREFAGDTMRINTEIGNLYKEHNVNAAAGCLPLVFQLPLMIGLYRVIQMPLTYVFKMSADTINAVAEFLSITVVRQGNIVQEAIVAQGIADNFASLVQAGLIEATQPVINFYFMGVSLAARPTVSLSLPALIAVLSAFTTFLMSYYQQKTVPTAAAAERMQKQMLYYMPLLMLYIGFTLPTTLSLYWGISNLLNMAQSAVMNIFWNPKKTLEQAYAAEAERARIAKERRAVGKRPNLGGLKAGELPPESAERGDDDDSDSMAEGDSEPKKKTSRRSAGGSKKEYEKVLKLSKIPSPYDDDD